MTDDETRAVALTGELRLRLRNADKLPDRDIESIGVLIDAGEWAVALETLCTQIYEYDLELNDVERRQLERLGKELGVAVSYLLGDPWSSAPGSQ